MGGHAPSYDERRDIVVGMILLAPGKVAPPDWTHYYTAVPDLGPVLARLPSGGSAKLDVWLGQYQGLPFKVGVICHWEFDRRGMLIGVTVTKEADAL